MRIKEVKLLDYLEHYMGQISDMFHVYAVYISKTYLPAVKKPCALRNPDAILEMQLQIHMSHFAYACKMRYPLNLVLENSKYLWFY